MALDADQRRRAASTSSPSTATRPSTRRSASSCSTRTIPPRVRSCLQGGAHQCALRCAPRSPRDMWEALNATWLAFDADRARRDHRRRGCPSCSTGSASAPSLFRGALLGTILRDDTYYFSQLGAFIERADNTARILDVKYFILLPTQPGDRRRRRHLAMGDDPALGLRRTAPTGTSITTAYRPWNIADFLILRRRCRARCASATTGWRTRSTG